MVLRLVMALFLILAVLLGGCKQAEVADSDTEKGEIIVGYLEDLSGPGAATFGPQTDGGLDAFRYMNEEQDGILGHPVRPVVIDFKMDPALATSGWDRLRDEGAVVVFSSAAAVARMIVNFCEQDHIVLLGGSVDTDELFPKQPSFYFSTFAHAYGAFDSMCDMVEQDWVKKGEGRPPRIGFDLIALGNYPKVYGKAGKLVAEKRGWDYIVTNTSISPADVTTQVLQMKEFNPDYVCLYGSSPAIIAWFKDMDRQDFYPVIFGLLTLGDPETWRAVGDLCIGSTFYQHGPQWSDSDLEGIKLLHDLNARWHPDVESRPGAYPRGFAHAMAVSEAIKRAIENVGYENLNSEAVRTAMETITDFDPMGWGAPYTWTATDHQGTTGCLWYKWAEGGTMVRVSDWIPYEPLPQEWRTTAWWLTD